MSTYFLVFDRRLESILLKLNCFNFVVACGLLLLLEVLVTSQVNAWEEL